ncbi:Retinal-specific ATP-binding cassette transporter [Orchesella cincta]|uniref:Retinal-specific ATP-binding cassette transporter n=1 Tax=Orchesella cincta TaxID=48709 RepID=A0A1D2N183_ORCCI|nr:Retinal-specific ATP-binding cassette transporter [Orchesella cincta]
MACFPVFQRHNLFTAYGGVGVAFTILLLSLASSIWLSYIASLFSRTAAGGFALVAIVHILSGVAISFLVYVFENNEEDGGIDTASKWRWFGRLFPCFGASMSAMRFSEIALKNGRCNALSDEAKEFLCDPMRSVPAKFRDCCDNCDQLPEVNCSMPLAYFTWIHKRDSLLPIFKDANDTEDNSTDPGLLPDVPQIELPGIKQELLFMIIQAPIYFAILMLLEYEVFGWLFGMLCQRKYETSADSDAADEDVLVEKHRVAEMVKTEQVNEDALVVESLCKSFGSFTAVSNLSFGVHPGECFGLLGVNGAGKTTSFRMITGDETHSLGNAHAFNTTLEKDRKKFLSNIGYCPQFDAIIGVLSGRQMLQLFGRLRGVPGNAVGMEADKWLEKFGLTESANVQCHKYTVE